MKSSVAKFHGHVQMYPVMVDNLLKPVFACGADFFFVVNVILLDLVQWCLKQPRSR